MVKIMPRKLTGRPNGRPKKTVKSPVDPKAPPSEWKEKYPEAWKTCEDDAKEVHWMVSKPSSLKKIAFVGHGTLLSALAVEFVEDPALKAEIMAFAIPECGAIIIRDGKPSFYT